MGDQEDEEIQRIRAEQNEMGQQLALVKFLQNAVKFKEAKINGLNDELQGMADVARGEVQVLEAAHEVALHDEQHKVRVLTLELESVKGRLRAYQVLEPEVATLRNTVQHQQAAAAEQARNHKMQLEEARDEFCEFRLALQQEFADTCEKTGFALHESTEQLMARMSGMQQQNEMLNEALQRADKASGSVLDRFQRIERQCTEAKLELSLVREELESTQRKSVCYKRRLQAALAENEQLRSELEAPKLVDKSVAGSGSGRRSGRRRRTPQGGGAESPLGATEAHSPASRGADGGGGGDDTGDGSCSELSLRSAALDSFLDDLGTESEFARRGCSAEPASRGKGNKGRSKGKAGGVPRGPQRRPASGSAAIPRVGRAGSADSLHSGFRLPARRAASATERRREVEEDGYALPSAQTRRPMSGNFNVLD